jgi:hypothetical protein
MLRIITRAVFIALPLCAVTLMALVLHSTAPAAHTNPLFPGARIDQATLHLFQRSCQNCHSENTEWPWYSRIPTASWMIAKDVREARAHVNFSHWTSYGADQQENLLTRIGAVVRTRRMPLSRYTFLHREAILTASERQQIYEWSRGERRRLRATGTGSDPSSSQPVQIGIERSPE